MHSTRYIDGVHPRFTVVTHPPLSRRGGCHTFTVLDRRHGKTVFGPCTRLRQATAMCDLLSRPADMEAVRAFVDEAARQMAMILVAEA